MMLFLTPAQWVEIKKLFRDVVLLLRYSETAVRFHEKEPLGVPFHPSAHSIHR